MGGESRKGASRRRRRRRRHRRAREATSIQASAWNSALSPERASRYRSIAESAVPKIDRLFTRLSIGFVRHEITTRGSNMG